MHSRTLSPQQIIRKIESGLTFEAISEDQSFYIKIEEYDPYVCLAIHHGHQLREELLEKCMLSDKERWYEEDPFTGDFISALPIVIIGLDSRYEYDLNRPPESCIYEEAWGKQVWKKALTEKEKEISLKKHEVFYKVVETLVKKLENQFNACLVFDIHSYNYKRYVIDYPIFNLGTANIDTNRFGRFISFWMRELGKIELPNLITTVNANTLFLGNGYLLKNLTDKFSNTLVFATEIKKVYCDEKTGEDFPLVIEALKDQMKKAILTTAFYFAKRNTNLKVVKKNRLLSNDLDKEIISLDKQLYKIVRNFEILNYVNPVNLERQKSNFFKSKYNSIPEFRYPQLVINPYEFKRKLFQLEVEKINDPGIQHLYKDVINAYSDKIDILANLGTQGFFYNCLRYYGEPDENDINNAKFLLSLPTLPGANGEENLTDQDAYQVFKETINSYGFNCKIEFSRKIVAKALVINHKKLVIIKKGARFSEQALKALASHEIGVHMVTTMNANLQPLQIFNIGLPVNDITQEGLAVLSEHLSGNMSIERLKELALRVILIRNMINGWDFRESFLYLTEEIGMNENKAFTMTTRIYRGGGFTKDHVYLRGFRTILKYYLEGNPLDNLMIGKTSFEYLNTINEMIDRKMILPPKFKNKVFLKPENRNEILEYVLSGLR
jgi:uncharacterized protein (TIGR02421 family)